MIEPDFGNWLAGFIDGEGCFIIQQINHTDGSAGNYMARFIINVRADEEPIVRNLIAATGLGIMTHRPGARYGANDCPQVQWQVQSKSECLALVSLLDRFVLRAKKRRDYAIWREAVLLWAAVKPGTDNSAIWDQMAECKSRLVTERVYVPSGTNGTPLLTQLAKP